MFGDGDDGGEVLRGRVVFEGGVGPCGDGGGGAAGLGKEGGGAGGGGAEDDAREGAVEVGAGVVGGVPGELGAEGEAVEGGGGHVEVAVVAPVGVEEAARAVLVSGAGVGGDDGAGFFHGVEDLSESAHGWADDGGEVALGEGVAFGEVVGGKVGPVEDGGVVGEGGEGVGVVEEHVAPEHEGFSVAGGFAVEEAEVVGVLSGEVGGGGVGGASAEVVGFVPA